MMGTDIIILQKGIFVLLTLDVVRRFYFVFYFVLLAVIWRIMLHSAQKHGRYIYYIFFRNFISFLTKRVRERKEVSFFTHILTMGILTHWLQMSYTMV